MSSSASALNAQAIAENWLQDFSSALHEGNIDAVLNRFHPDGWLRDVLTFSWDSRSLSGHAQISSYLKDKVMPNNFSSIQLDGRKGLQPEYGLIPPSTSIYGVSAGFTFKTQVATGQGYAWLVQRDGEWKAFLVHMILVDLIGHEEANCELGIYKGHTQPWADVREERIREVESNPHVLIMGAGQNGLQVAARFKQMGIPTLVVETNKRVGDNWRKRYPTMTLHTTRFPCEMLYQPYPKNYPLHIPKDKLADWLEHYAVAQDLVVWTDSRVLPTPVYDNATRTWTVNVDRAGQQVTLRPKHILIACGTLGAPRLPSIPDQDKFKGRTLHSVEFSGGAHFKDRNVVVVGAGNTSADICQDLAVHNASVTMVQRSSTCVVKVENVRFVLNHIWPQDTPLEINDFKYSATPLNLMIDLLAERGEQNWALQKDIHDGLRKAGLKLNMGVKDSGHFPSMTHGRFGGYWLDVGCAKLIEAGKVKIKHGVEVARFTEDSVIFTDGSSIKADTVIFATGHEYIRDTMRSLFGDKTIDQTGLVWGLDEEGEVRGCYRPSGHPGLWYVGGDFIMGRLASKQLALQIKAIELGLMNV